MTRWPTVRGTTARRRGGWSDRQHDHQPSLQVEQPEVLRPGQVVDDQLEQDRVDGPMLTVTTISAAIHVRRSRYGRKSRRSAGMWPGRSRTCLEVRLTVVAPGSAAHHPGRLAHSSVIERKALASAIPASFPAQAIARGRWPRPRHGPDLAVVAEERIEADLEGVADVEEEVRLLDAGDQHLAHLPRLEPLLEELGEASRSRRRVDRREGGLAGCQVVRGAR